MNKELYRLLNEIQIDLEEYEPEHISAFEKKRIERNIMKKNNKNRNFHKIAASALVVVCIGTGVMFNNDVYAFVETVKYKLTSIWDIENVDKYGSIVNTSEKDKGYTVTLNEVVLDNDELIISKTISSEFSLGEFCHTDAYIKINGKTLISGMSGASKLIDEFTEESIEIYDISRINLKHDAENKIEYNIKRITTYDNNIESIENGNWNFSFMATGAQLITDTLNINLNEKIVLPNDRSISLTKYTSNSINQKIYFDIDNKEKSLEYQMELRGTDDLGNDVVFYISQIRDAKGLFKVETIDNGYINDDAVKLTLIPYAAKNPNKSGRMNSDYERIDQTIVIDIK